MEDIDEYDKKCKVEPLMRALKEADTEAWINGRRRDHGFERAALPIWEGGKVRQGFLIWRYLNSGGRGGRGGGGGARSPFVFDDIARVHSSYNKSVALEGLLVGG